ncbi:MAG: hypothetical protein MJE68_25480 [Proteobacteria bacterium]|nr:hypothetical protein [Pseudomonadota bacterium]
MLKLIKKWQDMLIAVVGLILTILTIATFFGVGFVLYDSSLTQSDFEEFKVEFTDDTDDNFDELRGYMDGRFDRLEMLINDSDQQGSP